MTLTLRVMISGFGGVGRQFARLLVDKREQLLKDYDLQLVLTAIASRDGAALADPGKSLPLDAVIAMPRDQKPSALDGYGRNGLTVPELIELGVADVLIETTPTNIRTGEPGLSHISRALQKNMHVVSATKGPLVLAYDHLRWLADNHGVGLKFSSATAAALPAFDLGYYCLAGTSILRLEGILNGTTNFILSRMQELGESYTDALAEAQKRGIAEPDPTLDVEGWDSANKLVLIVNALLGAGISLKDLPVSGITGVTADDLAAAARDGATLKLIARADVVDGKVEASVQVRALPADHPLAGIGGSEKGITYTTDTMDRLTVTGGKSDPRAAAAAMLKDVINLAREYRLQPAALRQS